MAFGPDLQPFVALLEGELVAYGELMQDFAQGEAEILRLLVAPAWRGQGLGAAVIEALIGQIKARESPETDRIQAVYARIFPQNAASQRCFSKVGFERVDPEREAEFNQWDAVDFVWLERRL